MDANEAAEIILDVVGRLAEGKDDDDLVFIDGHLRALAEHWNITADWPEIEPVTAAEFRQRWRDGKASLAREAAEERER